MQTLTPWQRWGRTTLLGSIALASGWSAFVASSPVPLFDWFDLGVHEAGHLVAAPLSEIAMFMAGSFAQIAFPLVMAWYFGIRRRDRAAGGFCLAWAGASAWDVSVYAGDAVAQSLPLVGGGQHDWAFILGYFDALPLTSRVSDGIELAGAGLCLAGVGLIGAELMASLRHAMPMVEHESESAAAPSDDPWLAVAQLPFRHGVVERSHKLVGSERRSMERLPSPDHAHQIGDHQAV